MKYSYSVVVGQKNVNGRNTKRPIGEIELSRGNQRRKFLALIDSGADQIVMPASIADALGIHREQCHPRTLLGISMESVDGFLGELNIHIQHQDEAFTAPVVFHR